MCQKNNDHCCNVMAGILARGSSALFYVPELRRYAIKECCAECNCNSKKDRSLMMINVIKHCPWCGSKLPKDLSNIWEETIERECGIDPYDKKEIIPKEFHTDEWWKKRGL